MKEAGIDAIDEALLVQKREALAPSHTFHERTRVYIDSFHA